MFLCENFFLKEAKFKDQNIYFKFRESESMKGKRWEAIRGKHFTSLPFVCLDLTLSFECAFSNLKNKTDQNRFD